MAERHDVLSSIWVRPALTMNGLLLVLIIAPQDSIMFVVFLSVL